LIDPVIGVNSIDRKKGRGHAVLYICAADQERERERERGREGEREIKRKDGTKPR
jgi:hypothetical protein